MFWPFARRTNDPPARRTNIEAIYGTIVAQARLPYFYARLGVPDTVDGRFEMIVVHLWTVLRRLRALGADHAAQVLFDHFCSDMDGNLRELGVADLAVPRRMAAFGEAFYGRTAAYDAALGGNPSELSAALARNVLSAEDANRATALAAYVTGAISALEAFDADALLAGAWHFPRPNVVRTETYAAH